jgi:cephalosporin hydroxylase
MTYDMQDFLRAWINKAIVNGFHKFYYDSRVFFDTYWLGVQTLKCPLDLWVYQEIIHEQKPDAIIECGTYYGGSALFMASVCDGVNNGQILTIDLDEKDTRPLHPRIHYLHGSSTSREIVDQVASLIRDCQAVMAILDSEHHKEHVLNELRIYSNFVTKNSYLIVEDTNVNGHPVLSKFGPGAMEAVDEFLRTDGRYVVDETREKFHLTFNPKGYLKRIY